VTAATDASRSRRAAVRALAPLALMAAIFFFSAQEDAGPDVGSWARVVAHFGEYALLAGLWVWALAPWLGRRALPAAGAIAFLYAITDEWHQSFIPGRDADPLDVLVDACGIALALVLAARGRWCARPWQRRTRA
jgi:VanZ family protein